TRQSRFVRGKRRHFATGGIRRGVRRFKFLDRIADRFGGFGSCLVGVLHFLSQDRRLHPDGLSIFGRAFAWLGGSIGFVADLRVRRCLRRDLALHILPAGIQQLGFVFQLRYSSGENLLLGSRNLQVFLQRRELAVDQIDLRLQIGSGLLRVGIFLEGIDRL